ncbi:MAG: response regulator, partial [Pseudomonadota bacterium]
DLVITDLTMPHMTGYELALKLIGFKPGIPVILSTGYNERNRASLEKEQSITAVLTKPFNRRVLTETIRKALISTS